MDIDLELGIPFNIINTNNINNTNLSTRENSNNLYQDDQIEEENIIDFNI